MFLRHFCSYISAFDLPEDGVIRKSPERGSESHIFNTNTPQLEEKPVNVLILCDVIDRERKGGPAGLPEAMAK